MAIQLRSSTRLQPSPSSSTATALTKASSGDNLNTPQRRSARLSTIPLPLPTEQSHRKKRVRLTAQPQEPLPPPQPTPRALRLEKRNKERKEPPPPSRKRKTTNTDDLVVKKKPRRSPCRISATNSVSTESDLELTDIPLTPIPRPPSPTPITADPIEDWENSATPPSGSLPSPAGPIEQPANHVVELETHVPFSESEHLDQDWYNHPPQPQYPQQRRPSRPPRPRQEGLHEQVVKAKMWELRRLFSDSRIREEVDKEARAYYNARGLCAWSHEADAQDPDQFAHSLTWDDEHALDDLPDHVQKYPDVDDDTDEDDDDDDEIDESFGGEVLDLSPPPQDPSTSPQAAPLRLDWNNNAQPTLMTSFSSQEVDPQTIMFSPSSSFSEVSIPQYNDFAFQNPPPMMNIPVDTPLPRLSSIKVMGLRHLFDIGPQIEEEEETSSVSFTDSSLLSSATGLSPDQLRTPSPPKRRHIKGTPVDPARRAMWAAAGAPSTLWALDSSPADIGMSFAAMGQYAPQPDWDALFAGTSSDGVDKFTAFQQVCAVLSGVATNYST